MLRKFDKYARQDCFAGHTREEFEAWREEVKQLLEDLLGLKKWKNLPCGR